MSNMANRFKVGDRVVVVKHKHIPVGSKGVIMMADYYYSVAPYVIRFDKKDVAGNGNRTSATEVIYTRNPKLNLKISDDERPYYPHYLFHADDLDYAGESDPNSENNKKITRYYKDIAKMFMED